MLTDSLTLGSSTWALIFTKQFPDKNNSAYTVRGLASNAARNLTVSHQPSSTGRVRTMFRLDEIDLVPGSTTGETEKSSVYVVVDRGPNKSPTAIKDTFKRLKTMVDDGALQDQLLAQEV